MSEEKRGPLRAGDGAGRRLERRGHRLAGPPEFGARDREGSPGLPALAPELGGARGGGRRGQRRCCMPSARPARPMSFASKAHRCPPDRCAAIRSGGASCSRALRPRPSPPWPVALPALGPCPASMPTMRRPSAIASGSRWRTARSSSSTPRRPSRSTIPPRSAASCCMTARRCSRSPRMPLAPSSSSPATSR